MNFRAQQLAHGERVNWKLVTHVRLKRATADTRAGQRVLDHIRVHADDHGLAKLSRITPDFLSRKKGPRGMQIDLRHMANRRDAGKSVENKGLLDLGTLA